MKSIKNLLLFCLMLFLLVTSCKKDDPSRTELLTNGDGWKFQSLTSNSEEITEAFITLIFSALPPENQTPENEAEIRTNLELELDIEDLEDCDKDDVIIFAMDGSIIQTSGTNKCDAGEPDEGNLGLSTWSFNGDETVLTLVESSGFMNVFEIFSMSESRVELVLRSSLLDTFDEEEFEEFKEVAGYADFIASDLLITLTMVAN